jgi:uncharacterized protein YjdB
MLLGCALLAPVACSDDGGVTAPAGGGVNIPRIVITPGTSTLRPGATVQLAAEVRDGATGNVLTGQTVTWASADTLIARVSSTGLVTVVAPGTTGITARYGPAAIGTASVVVLGPVAAVSVTAAQSTITAGSTTQLSVSATDASGVPQAREITYTSSAPTVASVSGTGSVTAVGAGTATITATSEGRSGTVTITVLPPIAVLLTPATAFVGQGGTQQLTVTLRDPATGALLTGQTPVYTTSDAAVATVSATGLVTMVGPGTATITATNNGRTGTATVSNVLTSGTGFTYSGTAAQVRTFYVNVPAGATRLVVATTGAATTEDVDIMIFAPGGTTALCTSEGPNLNESCTLNAPLAPGLYRIRVESFGVYNSVTLRATVTP